MTDDTAGALIKRARALTSPAEAVALYRDWAATYDRDVFERARVTGSRRVADLLAAHVADRATAVVDIGCGTGAVGEGLRHHGFATVDGIDISPAMLEVAAAKGLYRSLHVVDLTRPYSPATRYGAAVSAGTFTCGHVGADVVPTLAALLEPGGVLACAIGQPLWPAFERALEGADFTIVEAALEAIRPAAPPESMMLVARRR
jgi:predicted TPR repeat methyltransferase